MTAACIKLTEIAEQLNVLCQKRATGELIIKNSGGQGGIHLLSGRLLYATAGIHPVRRWERALKQHCPNWIPDASQINDPEMWEYQLLYQGIVHKQISVTQAKAVIRSVSQEVFFDLGCYEDYETHWVGGVQQGDTELALSLSLSFLEVEPELQKAISMQEQWQAFGLGSLSPTLAPVLKTQLDPEALSGLGKYLKGQLTLWDISLKLGKSVHSITRALVPLYKKRVLQFHKIADLAVPIIAKAKNEPVESPQDSNPSHQAVPATKGLIACIDDSPVVLQTLKKILEPAGYETIGIQEPMRGVAQLIENQPDLIILDLVMPNASGYSVCKFLRQTSVFEKTPIIVLTSRDTIIDRNRAKLVGATDFLGKPPDPEKTLQLVQKHLKSTKKESENSSVISGQVATATS